MRKIGFVFIIVLIHVGCTERNVAKKSKNEFETKEGVISLNQSEAQIQDTSRVKSNKNKGLDSLELSGKERVELVKQQREQQQLRMQDVMTIIREKVPGRTREERKLLIDSVYTAFGLGDMIEKRNKRRKILENDSLRTVD